MYSNYTPLQQEQLLRQTCPDTQSCYLLVYAPGRSVQLSRSLDTQLHRKFRLVSSLSDQLTPSVEGVLLAAEDAGLMSTALSFFADALQRKFDYIICDAVYGCGGVTAVCQSTAHRAGVGYALVSRPLLDRCRAAARDPENVSELLTLAGAFAENPYRIPEALLHFGRDVSPADLFSAKGKRVLILSHLLDMTGAPIVLVSAVPVLRQLGYEVAVLGPEDGGSLELFSEAGAVVVTRAGCVSTPVLLGLAFCADLVLANTVVEARAVRTLNGSAVPVLWWLHDAFAGYPHIAHQIPKVLENNVRVYSVGSHAAAAMKDVRPDFDIRPLIYGLPDYAAEDFPRSDLAAAIGYPKDKPLFATVGSFEQRKGQDIFCQAIRLLPPETRAKASFLFVGKAAEKSMMDAVRDLTADYPESIFYCKRLTRDEIKTLMERCDCLVCASQDDPMPTFVTEGLIFGKPAIVSEHTGTAGLVTEGVDGFVYHDDDPAQLAKALAYAIEHPDVLNAMHPACRKLYETHYSKQAFEQSLTAAVRELEALSVKA